MSIIDREEEYDANISKRLTDIATELKNLGVPFLLTCQLNEGGDDGALFCTSAYVPEDSADKLKLATAIITGEGFDVEYAGEEEIDQLLNPNMIMQ